jgi:hypothetical protein
VSLPMRDLFWGVGDSVAPVGRRQGAPKPWELEALGCSPALGSN